MTKLIEDENFMKPTTNSEILKATSLIFRSDNKKKQIFILRALEKTHIPFNQLDYDQLHDQYPGKKEQLNDLPKNFPAGDNFEFPSKKLWLDLGRFPSCCVKIECFCIEFKEFF
jgi:hypothetical protein